jgi:hypothetical protein
MTVRLFLALIGLIALLQVADDLLTWSVPPAQGRRLPQFRVLATAIGGSLCAVGACVLPGAAASPDSPVWQVDSWIVLGTVALSLFGLVRNWVMRVRRRGA